MPLTANQLLDIRGLDPASWWPPAIGWWLVAFALILAILALPHIWRFFRQRPPRWQRDALRQLHGLRRQAGKQDAKQTAGELSELLRRIAMARFGRESCAGLSGEDWLHWLETRDPTHFDWRKHGRLLLDLPYAPPSDRPGILDGLQKLIDASLLWVVASKEPRHV